MFLSVCRSRSVGNLMFRTCSNGVTAAHLSPTLNYDAIQQRFLFLEPQSATTLSALLCTGFNHLKHAMNNMYCEL